MSGLCNDLVLFRSGPIRFGLDVDLVQRVLPACEISPLPGGPETVAGVVTLGGEIVAVVDPLPAFCPDLATALAPTSRFLLVSTTARTLALIAEEVDGVRVRLSQSNPAPLPASPAQLREIAAAPDGLIYIADPECLLSAAEEGRLSAAILEFEHGG